MKRRIYSADRMLDGRLRHTTQYLHQANMKIAVPMLVSSKGDGTLFTTQSPAVFSDTQYGSWFYTEADEYLDYCFLAGENMEEITVGYRQLTGRASMLPKWAYGYIQSQERYETAEEILHTADRRQLGDTEKANCCGPAFLCQLSALLDAEHRRVLCEKGAALVLERRF